MAITIPNQIRSLDPYSDHRFSNTINRFNRVFTRGEDTIMPFDNAEFNMTLMTSSGSQTISGTTYTWTANKAIRINPGIVIKDDVLIHVKNNAYVIFTDPTNYVGSGIGYNAFDSTGKYFILLQYNYSRSIPAPSASYVIAKQRNEFLLNRDKYVYLGTANVELSGSYIVTSISTTDVDETNGDAIIEKPFYEFLLPEVDGGDLD